LRKETPQKGYGFFTKLFPRSFEKSELPIRGYLYTKVSWLTDECPITVAGQRGIFTLSSSEI
jgi:hypothetical protein